jgi:hypothetical protein
MVMPPARKSIGATRRDFASEKNGKEKYLSQFIVSESESHYFFLDFSLAAAKAKSIEV